MMKRYWTSARISAGLLCNGFRYRLLRLIRRPGKPQAVSLEITRRCVCRCVMCNIWTVGRSEPELSLREWVALLSRDFFQDLRELDVTGGEPFLRNDLPSLIRAVCDLTHTHLRRLRSIAITTNGVLTERVLNLVQEMLEPVQHSGLELVIVCGLDAVGQDHDAIRRYKGAWYGVDRTISGLVNIREGHPALIVGIKTTVLPENVDQLGRIAQYARERDLFTIISPAIVTSGRYLNTERASAITLSPVDRARLVAFYEGPDFRWSYHADTVAHYLRTGEMKKPCTCGFNYFFVRSDGEVLLCPLLDGSAGNVRAAPIEVAYTSARARSVRRRIGRSPECARCTEPGLERYSLPYEGFAYLRNWLRLGPRAFLAQHQHMGLDKYM